MPSPHTGPLRLLPCLSDARVDKYTNKHTTQGTTTVGSWQTKRAALRLGGVVPALKEVTPASSGSAVLVSWSWPEAEQRSTSGEDVLHYVVEWTSVPAAQLQWQMLDKSQNSTSITGMEHLPWKEPQRAVMREKEAHQRPLVAIWRITPCDSLI